VSATKYTWQPASCPTCNDPEARLVSGDSDRADIMICTRCPHHGGPSYHDPRTLLSSLAAGQVLAMRDEILCVGTPATPEGLSKYTLGLVRLAQSKGMRATWTAGKRTHHLHLSCLGPHGASGFITVGANSGRILRGHITHGNDGPTVHAEGTTAVRALIAPLTPSQCPPYCDAKNTEACAQRSFSQG
jgi:hypothetical protein